VIQKYLNMDVVDELEIALAPVLFGGGRRLFENLREPAPQFRIDKVLDGPAATHVRYVRQWSGVCLGPVQEIPSFHSSGRRSVI